MSPLLYKVNATLGDVTHTLFQTNKSSASKDFYYPSSVYALTAVIRYLLSHTIFTCVVFSVHNPKNVTAETVPSVVRSVNVEETARSSC